MAIVHRRETGSAPDGVAAVNAGRRDVLVRAAATAALCAAPVRAAAKAASPPAPAPRIDRYCRVTRARLDSLVAGAFPLFDTAKVLPAFDAGVHGAACDVDLYRITTSTALETGQRVPVTALLALPAVPAGRLPLLSWQHGTILSFDQVPSNLTRLADPAYTLTDASDSLETLFNVQRFAGHGYAVVAADYIGKGPLRQGRGEAYAVKGLSTRTCEDVLRAGRHAMRALGFSPSTLFLHGWSQGALNTQWLHQALRQASHPIAATAVASPFNDLNEAWSFWAGAQAFALPAGVDAYPALPNWIGLCMIVLLRSYETYYGIRGLVKSALRPAYHDLALQYAEDYQVTAEITNRLPSGADLLVPEFFAGFTADGNSAFLRRLAANRASYWRYDSPIRFHYGLADEAIHPAMVQRALGAGGELAEGVPVARASHRATFLAGMYGDRTSLAGRDDILDWFNGVQGRPRGRR